MRDGQVYRRVNGEHGYYSWLSSLPTRSVCYFHFRFTNAVISILFSHLGPVAPTMMQLEPSSNSTLTLVQSQFSLHHRGSALNVRWTRLNSEPSSEHGSNFDGSSHLFAHVHNTPLSLVTSFSMSHNKTHKSWLEYEIKCDLYKIASKNRNLKIKNWGFLNIFKKTSFLQHFSSPGYNLKIALFSLSL